MAETSANNAKINPNDKDTRISIVFYQETISK